MIILFSGCGNTAAVAACLARITGDEILRLDATLLRDGDPAIAVTGTHVVWAFPTYSWGVPPVVRRFMKRVRLLGAAHLQHAMVTTCGDDAGDCASMWRACVRARGWHAGRAFSVQMPNTYTTMSGFDVDAPSLADEKLAAMPARVAQVAAELNSPGPDDVVRGSWPRFKTRVIYPWFVRMEMSPRPFRHTDACIACGKCMRACPMANIAPDENGRPVWGGQCAFCLGCYNVCPVHAVAYGRKTLRKGQYYYGIGSRPGRKPRN